MTPKTKSAGLKTAARTFARALFAAAAAAVLLEGGYRAYLTARSHRGGNFELYAIGGSSTYGEPYDHRLSFPALAGMMLDSRVGGRKIVIDNLARPGDSIYPEAVALAGRLRFRNKRNPAAVLIYAGHNEHFTGPRTPGPLGRAYFSVRDALLYRSFFASAAFCGLERHLGERGERSMETYERHLRAAIEFSLASGAVPILSTLISNTTEVEPSLDCPASLNDALIPMIRRGRLLETRAPAAQAERFYRTWPAKVPCLAPLADYRLAKLAEAAGDFRGADALYWKVIDEDPQNGFGRTTTRQNALLRRLAAEYKIPLVDSVALFAAASPHGLIGPGLLSDGHHPNLEGYLILARAYAAALSTAFHEPIKRPLDTAAQARTLAGFKPNELAGSLIYSGRWLLTVSVKHPSPLGRMALARRSFEAAAALDPKDFRARLGLALVHANGDGLLLFDKAAVALVERLALDKNDAHALPAKDELFETALMLLARGAPPAVIGPLLRTGAPSAAPDDDVSLLRRALEARDAGTPRSAGDLLLSLSQRHPEEKRISLALAEAATAAGDRRRALEALLQAERRESDPIRLLTLSKDYEKLADPRHAAGLVKDAARRYSSLNGKRLTWTGLAEAAFAAHERETALQALAKAEESRSSPASFDKISALYAKMAETALADSPPRPEAAPPAPRAAPTPGIPPAPRVPPPAAVSSVEPPQGAGYWITTSEGFLRTGDRASALTAADRAVHSNPAVEDQRRIAGLYSELREYAKSSVLLDALALSRPQDAGLLIDQARLAVLKRDRKRAFTALAAATALKPSDEDWSRIAQAYQDLSEPAHAAAVWKRLTARHPDNASYLHDQAVSEYASGAVDSALRNLRAAQRLAPDRLETYLTLGYVYSAQGRRQDALAAYDQGLARPSARVDAALRALILETRRDLASTPVRRKH